MKYLRDLHNVYNSWHLAMASYNCGEACVMRGIMKSGTRDFWELVQRSALPKETLNYVPKYIAASIIAENPTQYGFEFPLHDPYPELQRVDVPTPIKLSDVAEVANIPLELIKDLNPQILKAYTPSTTSKVYPLWLPKEHLTMEPASLQETLASKKMAIKTDIVSTYRTKKGDTVASVSKKTGVSVANLKQWNRLKSKYLKANQILVLAPKDHDDDISTKTEVAQTNTAQKNTAKTNTAKASAKPSTVIYRVKRGDSLYEIAKKYGVGLNDLLSANKLRKNSKLYVGKKIVIPVTDTAGKKKSLGK